MYMYIVNVLFLSPLSQLVDGSTVSYSSGRKQELLRVVMTIDKDDDVTQISNEFKPEVQYNYMFGVCTCTIYMYMYVMDGYMYMNCMG